MRYFVNLLFLFLVFSDVYSQDFKLKGELVGFEDGTRIILNPFLDNMDVDMDNEMLLLLKDEKFEFSKHLTKPMRFSLRVRPKNSDNIVEFEQLTFWSENASMTLKGKKGEIFQSTIEGSLIQEQYFQYISSVAILENLRKGIVDSVRTFTNMSRDKKSEMRIRYQLALKTIEEKRMQFIFNNPNYYCAAAELVWYITFAPNRIDEKRLKEFYAKMSPVAQSNCYGKQIEILLKKDIGPRKVQFLEVGDYPFDFTLKDISGNEFKFSQIRNRVILLDFWASGCGPCRLEHKNYVSLYNDFRSRGLEIISVGQDQSKKRLMAAMAKDEMSWICLWDEHRIVSNDLYNISGLPANYLIIDGKVVGTHLRGEELRRRLYDVFNKSKN